MTQLRFFTDEDVYRAVAPALRHSGYDAVSTGDVARLGESDESQLHWATQEARVLVTFNVAHFAALHARWLRQNEHHAGIIVSSQRTIGDVLRRLLHLASSLDGEAMHDRLEFLSDW